MQDFRPRFFKTMKRITIAFALATAALVYLLVREFAVVGYFEMKKVKK